MFSTAQLDFMKPLVADMREQGYLYYLAYQNLLTGTNNDYDLIIYFSKEEIFGTELYKFDIPSHSLKYSVRSGNASSNNLYPRVVISEVELIELGLSVPEYAHISTNATFMTSQIQPDLCLEVQQYETVGSVSFMLCVFVCIFCIIHLFRR